MTFITGSRQLMATWFRVRGWGLSIGLTEPLPSSRWRQPGEWHHLGPMWFRFLRPSDGSPS